MTDRAHKNDRVHYIVVVHGMGEPRCGETVLPVINGFARARAADASRAVTNPITLGMVMGQMMSAAPWIEFAGIPQCNCPEELPFVGAPSSSGENLRFVDMFWGDITAELFKVAGQPLDTWTEALLDRVKGRGDTNTWIEKMLDNIRSTVVPIQKVLNWQAKFLSDLVFNRFLGDVQLYGECSICRDHAVARFHDTMTKVHERHHQREGERQRQTGAAPRRAIYTVIAHSLGTIMSFDALLAAWRDDRDWVRHVESYVTLGSPIDKFLTLWPENYAYLNDASWQARDQRIRHYNYCDEQDPVGHELDLAYETRAVQAVFGKVAGAIVEPDEQKVYVRYSLPGFAHIEYWKDADLMRRLLEMTVDGLPAEPEPADSLSERPEAPTVAHPVQWFDRAAYDRVLNLTYRFFPRLFWSCGSLCMILLFGITPQEWAVPGLATAALGLGLLIALVVLYWLYRRLMTLMINWRQSLVALRRDSLAQSTAREGAGQAFLTWSRRSRVLWSGACGLSGIFWAVLSFSEPLTLAEVPVLSPLTQTLIGHGADAFTCPLSLVALPSLCGMVIYRLRARAIEAAKELWKYSRKTEAAQQLESAARAHVGVPPKV